MKYKLLDIGVVQSKCKPVVLGSLDNGEPSSSGKPASPSAPAATFKHEGCHYIQLHPELNIRTYLRDIASIPEYELSERVEEHDPYTKILSVFLNIQSNGEEQNDGGWFKQRQRVTSLLFEEIEHHSFVKEELNETPADDPQGQEEVDKAPIAIQAFYEQLRLRHRAKLEADRPEEEHLSIPHLRPELRVYQEQAIRWMVRRETDEELLPAPYVRLRCRNGPAMDFYMDPYSYTVSDRRPEPIRLPAGGILADEMGLGKTVEMLGLMLLNKKTVSERGSTPLPPLGRRKKDAEPELRCLCFGTHTKNTIECRKCRRLQHRKCVLKHQQPEDKADKRYLCPECWRSEPLVETGATIIVSPVSIKLQWESEIRKHVSDPHFRVFIYNGLADRWISPRDLASYDVVLTDYNILRPEIYLVPEQARTSRHEKRRLAPSTPLTHVRWWRVCLDEAQMVEGVGTNVAKMVKALPAVHRWAVTGTPIEKTIDNLYGLVQFLDYDPYSLASLWRQYADRFLEGNAAPLLTAMARIMWRTCKHAVMDVLGVPPQTERIHYIQMSDLLSYFYRCEHNLCAEAFTEKARRIDAQQRMGKMDLRTLNQLLEPLRKLRQDCTIPSVLGVGQAALQGKKLLTPAELHEHLVTANVNDCKGMLRSMVSSLNGMAALEILQDRYDDAFAHYQASLRCADDYQGAISVDSLLQIHALHNLLDLCRSFGDQLTSPKAKLTDEQLAAYEEKRARLERRYLGQYASKVRSIEQTLRPAIERVDELIGGKPALPLDGQWWRELCARFDESPQRHAAIYSRVLHDQTLLANTGVQSWRSLDLWLLNWLDKLLQHRRALVSGFESLTFFVEHLQPEQPTGGTDETRRTQIDELVRTAFACHLDPALFEEDENGMRTSERIVAQGRDAPKPCLLCRVKDKLNMLEPVLFLVQHGARAATGGLWQVSRQEQVLKLIHQYAKRQQPDCWSRMAAEKTISESDHFMSFLERVKVEFKEYSQYWVEINYSVAAYDELGMCKSRLQLITLAEQLEQQRMKKKRSPLQLHESEVPGMLEELKQTRADSEREFVRLKGTLKYLEHLGAKKELDVCPICQIVPAGRYAVLQCGHHLCSLCLVRIIKMARLQDNRTTCVICRHQQHVKDMQFVQQPDKVHNIRGSYSSKIAKIVQTVLELVADEPTVKIVIFSHWEPILAELGVALAENDITFREKSVKFFRSVEDFKHPEKGITCLLLPLRFGSKGLNLTEATHVFLVEPILNPGEEMQAIGRVHRIGQTRPTFVHRFIMLDTIEVKIHETIQGDRSGRWLSKDVTVEQLAQLFLLDNDGNESETASSSLAAQRQPLAFCD